MEYKAPVLVFPILARAVRGSRWRKWRLIVETEGLRVVQSLRGRGARHPNRILYGYCYVTHADEPKLQIIHALGGLGELQVLLGKEKSKLLKARLKGWCDGALTVLDVEPAKGGSRGGRDKKVGVVKPLGHQRLMSRSR